MKFLLVVTRVWIMILFLDSCNSHRESNNMKYLNCLEISDGYRSIFSDVGREKQKALVGYAINEGILEINLQENKTVEIKNIELDLFVNIFKLICVELRLEKSDISQYVQNIKNDLMLFEVIRDFFYKFCEMTNAYCKFQGLYIDLCNESFSKAQIEKKQDNIFRILRESFLNYIKFSDSLSFSKSFLYKTKFSTRDYKTMSGCKLNLLETTNNSGETERKLHEKNMKLDDARQRLFCDAGKVSNNDTMLLEDYSNKFYNIDPLIAACFDMAKFVENRISSRLDLKKDENFKEKFNNINNIYISQIDRGQIEGSDHFFENLEISVVGNGSRDSFNIRHLRKLSKNIDQIEQNAENLEFPKSSIPSENSLRCSLAPFSERKIGSIKKQDISASYNNISHLNNEENNTSSFEVRENDNIRNIEQDLNSSEESFVDFSSHYKGYSLINDSRNNEVHPPNQSDKRSEKMKKLIIFKTQSDLSPEIEAYYKIENCNETNLYNFLVAPINKKEKSQDKMQFPKSRNKNIGKNVNNEKSFSKLKKSCEICISSQKKIKKTVNPVKIIPVFKP